MAEKRMKLEDFIVMGQWPEEGTAAIMFPDGYADGSTRFGVAFDYDAKAFDCELLLPVLTAADAWNMADPTIVTHLSHSYRVEWLLDTMRTVGIEEATLEDAAAYANDCNMRVLVNGIDARQLEADNALDWWDINRSGKATD